MYKLAVIALLSVLLLVSCENSVEPNKGPGRIIKIEMQDSIKIPATGNFNRALIEVSVEDPDGLKDIKSVFFYSMKPDSSYANNGNPFIMVDNGKPFSFEAPYDGQGDKEAGDGIYSFSMVVFNSPPELPPPVEGKYIFNFYSRDKDDNLSEVKTDSIEVYK